MPSAFPKALDALPTDAQNQTDAETGKPNPKAYAAGGGTDPTGEGDHPKRHNQANAAINALQETLRGGLPGEDLIADDEGTPVWGEGALKVTAYGAVADDYYTDGKVVSGSTTFTSASAKFTIADVGKTVVIGKGGPSSSQDHHTKIKEVKSATEVVLENAAQRSQEKCRWLISRAGDQTAAIQAAIEAAEKAGGLSVFFNGVGFLASQVTLKTRVRMFGRSRRGTCLHQVHQSNKPLVVTDNTENDSATCCSIDHMWLDGARARQSDVTTTLSSKYTAGDSVLKLTNAEKFLPVGMVIVGSVRMHYTSKVGNELKGITAGVEMTTDESVEAGATVTQKAHCAIYAIRQPFNTGGLYEESFDSHHSIREVLIKNFRGTGFENWAQSEVRCEDVWARNCDEYGFRPSFDTFVSNCIADTCGRGGFFSFGASNGGSNNKAFFCGGVTAEVGFGFHFEGKTNFNNEGAKPWMGCIAQDNKADGFNFRNCDGVHVTGSSSSNGTAGPAGTYCGARLDGCRRSIISLVCTERGSDGSNFWQQNAINVLATSRKCAGNKIRLTHAPSGGSATVGKAIKEGSDLSGGNDISINGMGGTVAPAYAAEVTVDPYEATTFIVGALTGNLTFKAPSNAHLGCRLSLVLTQDGTGGRSISWNEAFSTTGLEINSAAGSTTFVNFTYNGTKWVYEASGPSRFSEETLASKAALTLGANPPSVVVLTGTKTVEEITATKGGHRCTFYLEEGATLKNGKNLQLGADFTGPGPLTVAYVGAISKWVPA